MADSKKLRVLVIDDEPAITEIVDEFLSNAGYEALCLNTTSGWYDHFNAFQPHMILLDINMPGEDGYAVCSQLKADPATASVPVVFLTGRDRNEDNGRSFKAGGDMFIKKPFSSERLLGIVQIVMSTTGGGARTGRPH